MGYALLSGWLLTAEAGAQTPAEIDQLTHQWLATERQISRLEADWLAQQPILEQRIDLLQAERDQLQDILAASDASQDDVDDRREALLAQQDELEAEQQELAQALDGLVARLGSIQPLLPDPVRAGWENEQAMLSADPETSEQLQVALAQLSRLADFNTRISVQEAPMTVPDGSQVMVKQLYLGAGTAWFVSADGAYAGYGQPGIGGWQWSFDESVSATAIAEAIAIYERQQQAAFVRLPVILQSAGQNTTQKNEQKNGARDLNTATGSGSVQP
tara:strand:- start:14279 stop:15100 length:822 start_codon:yes stop_codon:yes gene_type:complete